MAFSTQREFMEVGFMNEHLEAVCSRKPDVKLKTYFSNTDTRAWATNEKKQANFLADLVACRTYIKDDGPPMPYDGIMEPSQDSLLQYATEKIQALDTIAAENRDELDESDERLKVGNDGNTKLKGILDEDCNNPLYHKIKALRGKTLTAKDEKDILMSLKILITRDKAVRVLEAENYSLRRIIEKLSRRAKYADVTKEGGGIGPETSNDVNYLQNTVNELKKEIAVLQGIESDYNKCKIEYDALKLKFISNPGYKKHYGQHEHDPQKSRYVHDAENNIIVDGTTVDGVGIAITPREITLGSDTPFARTIEERDNLRKQLARVVGLEDKIAKLRDRAIVADTLEKELQVVNKKLQKMDRGSLKNMAKLNSAKAELEEKQQEMEKLEAANQEIKNQLLAAAAAEKEMKNQLLAEVEKEKEIKNQLLAEAEKEKEIKNQLLAEAEKEKEIKNQLLAAAEREKEIKNQLLEAAEKDKQQIRDGLIAVKNLQHKNTKLMEDLNKAAVQLQRMKCIEQKLKVTENQLCRNECIIKNYECQFNQLMMVIEELEGGPNCCSRNNNTALVPSANCDFHLRDLALATKATLEQMKLELKARGMLQIAVEDGQNEVNLIRLKCEDEIKCCMRKCDQKCADLMCQLESCRTNNNELKASLKKVIAELLPDTDISSVEDKQVCEQLSQCCCDETKRIKKQSEDQFLEKCELQKKIQEIDKLQDKLEEEKDKYTVQREKSKALIKEKSDLLTQHQSLKLKLSESNEQLEKQQEILDQQKNLLNSSKQELAQYRDEMDKCNGKLCELECAVCTLTVQNETYEKRIKDDANEIQMLKSRIEELTCEIRDCEKNTDGGKSSRDELSNLRKSLSTASEQLVSKDNALKHAIAKADAVKAELDDFKNDFNTKIAKLKCKNQSLEREIKQSQTDMAEMMNLVGEIETERDKNRKLSCLVDTFDQQLNSVAHLLPTTDENLNDVIDTLKSKLEMEEKQRNELSNALRKSNAELLAIKQNAPITKIDSQNLISSTDVKKQVRSIEQKNSQGLLRLQSIHDDQMKDILKSHEKEIKSLKLCNKALRDSFTKLKSLTPNTNKDCNNEEIRRVLLEIKNGICSCKQKALTELTKLQKICKKIVDKGIESVSCKELTILHGEVYKAGLRLKPELLKVSLDEQKCCKCTDFSCCLPNISKDVEKKLISRIVFLETEVEKANKILSCLKKKHANEMIEWTINDDLAEFFKSFSNDNQCKKKSNLIVPDHPAGKCKSMRQTLKKRKCFEIPNRDIVS